MATLEMNADNFGEILENNNIVLIDFWADWCGPCKMFGPVFEEASEKHTDLAFAKVDTDSQQELAAQFGVRSIPNLAIFRDKILIFNQPGALPAESLEEVIQKVRDLNMDEVREKIEEERAQEGATPAS